MLDINDIDESAPIASLPDQKLDEPEPALDTGKSARVQSKKTNPRKRQRKKQVEETFEFQNQEQIVVDAS